MYEAVVAVTREVAIRARPRAKFISWFVLGLSIGLLMVVNSQLSGDQLQLLNLGWQLSHNHLWLPHGMITSAGGFSPGGFSALLVAGPLYLWNDYRAPALFTLLCHAAAFLLLHRTLKPALTQSGGFLLLALLWLSPWHLYFASHIWDANYMYVFAILHLVTAQRMAQRREIAVTVAHVLVLGLSLQVHTSGAVLCILSLLLFALGRLKISWTGLVLGLAICVASLVPWLLAVSHDPALLPAGKGFLLRGLVYVFPVLRGVLYWLKLTSLTFVERMYDLDFSGVMGPAAASAAGAVDRVLATLAQVTLIVAVWLQWRFFRKAWRIVVKCLKREVPPYRPRSWLRFYVTAMCAATLISFALSPTTIMFWQVFVAMPASAVAMVMSAEVLLRSRFRPLAQWLAGLWAALSVALLVPQAVAAPMYRCGISVDQSRPMLTNLHAMGGCADPHRRRLSDGAPSSLSKARARATL
ncbi:MAG TPA: hypothetical protein VGV09_07270 [Steroidobacteraceae bacterium]|nr:hypothetical protein [Steroidobacteraceae bacterium]